MHYSHSPVPATPATECSLVAGRPDCCCAQDADFLSERQIRARAADMFCWQQLAGPGGRAAARRGLDALLARVRARGLTAALPELLGIAVALRVHDARDAEAAGTDRLLAEFRDTAERSGDDRLLGEAAVLRAHRGLTQRPGENTLAAAAEALAVLTDLDEPGAGDPPDGAAALSRTLNGLVQVLLRLGAHEVADEVSQRAIAVSERTGSPRDRLVHQLNRVRLQLSWALRLERGGREAAASSRLVGAVQAARDAARLWAPAFGGNWSTGPAAAQDCPVVAAAYAFHRPGATHLSTLSRLAPVVPCTDDRILLAIATARCLLADGRPATAAATLAPLRDELDSRGSDVVLALALHREFAQVDAAAQRAGQVPGRARPGNDVVGRYATALEAELWTLHEAGIAALRSHCENHRLSRAHGALTREHGAVTAQLLEDPLTGLPNRRALDLRLAEATSEGFPPCAVALIDLDRFKDVNDGRSHAVGDVVLREIAGTMRRALRAEDLVARYGGDEFVVIMPGTSLAEASAALNRAARAVAELPREVAAGVTMSVGVVGAQPAADPAVTLAAADAAMYRAKHEGGNKVISMPAPPPGDAVPAPRAPETAGQASRVRFTVTSSAAAVPPEKMPFSGGTSA